VLKGLVREVAASADPVTRTFSVKVALSAQDAPALGATVSVLLQNLTQLQAPLIKLPTSSFRQEGASSAVWVLDPASMTVKLQPVQIATADGNDVVVASGLTPGMQVVVAGVHVLSPGQKVTIYKEKEVAMPDERARAAINTIATSVQTPTPAPAAK
jgi:multidrug efflux pump subunit AcrA (membrane-fusion protein)